MKNFKQLYAMAVCLISVIILIIGVGVSLSAVLSYSFPKYMSYSFRDYESDESFLDSVSNDKELHKELKGLSKEGLTEKRLLKRKLELDRIKYSMIRTILSTLPWIFIAFVFFFIHWRIYKKSSKNDTL